MDSLPLPTLPPPPTQKVRGILWPTLFCMILVVGGLCLFIYRNLWVESHTPVVTSSEYANLEQQLNQLHASMRALQERTEMASQNNDTTDATAIHNAVNALEQRLASFETRLSALETTKTDNGAATQEQAVLKFLLLRERIFTGKPYYVELGHLKAVASIPSDVIQTLSLHAEQGLPTTQKLIQLLEETPQPKTEPSEASDWGSKLTRQIDKFITIRRRSHSPADTDAYANITSLLQKDEFVAALSAAEALPPDQKSHLEPLILQLTQRISTLRAIESCIELIGTTKKEGN